MDNNIRYNMQAQTNNDASANASAPSEIPTLTVALPAIQVHPHSNALPRANVVPVGQAAPSTPVMMNMEEIPPPKPDFSAPPPYEVATKLPSYEEVQREKTLQGEPAPHLRPQIMVGTTNDRNSSDCNSNPTEVLNYPSTGTKPGGIRPPQQPLAFLALDTEAAEGDTESGLLGTDFMFFTAFMVAFLFNWIGFLLMMCFCHTIASRYGALSGFGLSLAKWTLIVKHSTDLASRENSWLWWLIMAFGVLICIRAIIQYLNIKRGWRLLSGSAQERLLFFY